MLNLSDATGGIHIKYTDDQKLVIERPNPFLGINSRQKEFDDRYVGGIIMLARKIPQ